MEEENIVDSIFSNDNLHFSSICMTNTSKCVVGRVLDMVQSDYDDPQKLSYSIPEYEFRNMLVKVHLLNPATMHLRDAKLLCSSVIRSGIDIYSTDRNWQMQLNFFDIIKYENGRIDLMVNSYVKKMLIDLKECQRLPFIRKVLEVDDLEWDYM